MILIEKPLFPYIVCEFDSWCFIIRNFQSKGIFELTEGTLFATPWPHLHESTKSIFIFLICCIFLDYFFFPR